MPLTARTIRQLTAMVLLTTTSMAVSAPSTVPAPTRVTAIEGHARALEALGQAAIDEELDEFENRFSASFLAETSRDARRELLSLIADAATQAGGAMLDEAGGEIWLSLLGPKSVAVVFEVESSTPFAIEMLRVEDIDESLPHIELGWDNAEETFRQLARDGFSGVVYLARKGEVVLEQAYGISNAELGYTTRPDTIYGIGSTPIDFTVAALYLLAQDGKVGLDDRITRYFDEVPDDKRNMTLRHLITGQSGLPDFHDKPGDWDPDLGWIDRDEAVARILAQPLLFVPGKGEAHSHSAYGLVAAIIEKADGKNYFDVLRDRILERAGMMRTGMYGDRGDFGITDFAEGRGARAVGIPNIPPNWGPTSWLVMGSGGMYSTLGDMRKFYSFVTSNKQFAPEYARRWSGEFVSIGGSERGFYMFHAFRGQEAEAMMLINGEGRSPKMQALSRALEKMVMSDD